MPPWVQSLLSQKPSDGKRNREWYGRYCSVVNGEKRWFWDCLRLSHLGSYSCIIAFQSFDSTNEYLSATVASACVYNQVGIYLGMLRRFHKSLLCNHIRSSPFGYKIIENVVKALFMVWLWNYNTTTNKIISLIVFWFN